MKNNKKVTMIRLREDQLEKKVNFINNYIEIDENAADASVLDANANIVSKNLSTLTTELHKDINIQINRSLISRTLQEKFGDTYSKEYIRQLENHEIYTHDESSLSPYCVSISMYPFLLGGMTALGGEAKAPKHLASFTGSFVNLIFAVSSQFAGAVASVEFLMCFDYFARKDYGDDYLKTDKKVIENQLQHVVYALNQPAAARGYQSVFWNISIFDKFYFNSIFQDFIFPGDQSRPNWGSLSKLQDFFMKWFNEERSKCLLTFPVVTAAILTEDDKPKDSKFADMCCKEMSEGNSFFVYMSDTADSLASCCRLRSEIVDNTFSYSLGAGGVSTGSINVITANINRLVQNSILSQFKEQNPKSENPLTLKVADNFELWKSEVLDKTVIDHDKIQEDLKIQIEKIHKYQVASRHLFEKYEKGGMLTVYNAGYISFEKQFLTIGVNGFVESAEALGISPTNNKEYKKYLNGMLKVIYNSNKEAKSLYGYLFNTEFVPAENLGVKNASWDKRDGYYSPRDCYNSYMYVVENEYTDLVDKFVLHGKEIVKYLDGGSALHLNLGEYPTQESYRKLFNISAKTGCNYFTTNVKITICEQCNNIDKRTLDSCPKCSSTNLSWATRVIGYLKKVSSFSSKRQCEESDRDYAGCNNL
ncbi:MAG: ribonucleoside-triphosphate reductase [Alphaproteobacteria bacterium]|nr:ribonucleoside-triphosphate reductase [Alphaproteobacteria bacterium]MBL0717793.1 ribonucleoside-triphosphate reductase [Alphaproteobacteria bacterium]